MKQEGLKFFTNTEYTLIAFIIFFVFFIGMTIWVFRKSAKKQYSQIANIPLEDQNTEKKP